MVTLDEQQVTKLTIDAYPDQRYDGPPARTWTALFNPTELTFSRTNVYNNEQAAGASRPSTSYGHGEPDEISLDFFLDGTGVVASSDSVRARVDALLELTRFQPDTHHPYYVHLYWAAFHFRGVLRSADVAYTLFDRSGEPVRATVTASFMEVIEQEDLAATERRESSDLHQRYEVGEDETLDAIAHRIYGDARFWRPIAEVNALVNPRDVVAGTVLTLPPRRQGVGT
jgi:hypothetical protein